jgi:hypothetical protein
MAMDREHFRELSLSFAAGLLEGREADAFLEALDEADEENLLIYAESALLAQDVAAAGPPPAFPGHVQEALRAAIGGAPRAAGKAQAPDAAQRARPAAGRESGARPEGWRAWFPGGNPFRAPGLGFAALVLGAGVLVYAFVLQSELGRKDAALEAARTQVSFLGDSLARREALLEVLLSHNLQVVSLQGHEKDPTGFGKMIWCPKRRCGILHVANLPPVPDGHEYQLWFEEADGGSVNAGLFRVRKTTWDGDLFRIQGMAEVERSRLKGFKVTLEPEGGSKMPTGDTYLSGSTLM